MSKTEIEKGEFTPSDNLFRILAAVGQLSD